MFEVITGVLLLSAAIVIWALTRRLGDTEQRVARAESAAALSWSKGYQEGATETYHKLQQEIATSYDKGQIGGWNACVARYEAETDHKEVTAA